MEKRKEIIPYFFEVNSLNLSHFTNIILIIVTWWGWLGMDIDFALQCYLCEVCTTVSSWSIKICYYMGFQSWEDASHWSVCVMHTIDACTPPLPQLCSGSTKTPQQPAPLQFFGLAWEHIVISPTRENIIHQQVRLATVQERLVGIFCVSTE